MNADIHTIFSSGDCPPHEQLLAYFRGTLTGEEKNRIEHHLMECEMCSDELGGLSKMKDAGKLPEIIAEIRSGLNTGQRKIIPLHPRILLLAAAATVALIIGVVFLFRFIPSRQHERILTRQPERALSMEMNKPVQLPPSRPSSPPPAASAGKPLLALVKPPKEKEEVKAEEKTVPIESEEMIAYEVPKTSKPLEDNKALIVEQQDSATRVRSLGYAPGVEVLNYNGKIAALQPSPLAEKKTDMARMVIKGTGPGTDDAAMILYQKADYRQASILFEKKLAVDSTNSAVLFYLADCWFHLKEYLTARQLLQKLINDPKDPYYVKGTELRKKVEEKIK